MPKECALKLITTSSLIETTTKKLLGETEKKSSSKITNLYWKAEKKDLFKEDTKELILEYGLLTTFFKLTFLILKEMWGS